MDIRNKILLAVYLLVFSFLSGTVGYYIIGHLTVPGGWSWFDCAFMTLITLSTVGYTDLFNMHQNPPALVFTGLVMLMGLGIVAYSTGTLAALVLEGDLKKAFRRRKMNKELVAMIGHYIVCGGGNTGFPVIAELLKTGNKVCVVDTDHQRLEKLHEKLPIHYVVGDCADDEVLIEAGVKSAKGIFAILPSDKDNLFVTVTARGLNADIRIISKAIDLKMQNKLVRSGADGVISPNTIGGLRMASEMVRPSVVRFLDKMLRTSHGVFRIEEVPVQAGSFLDGRQIKDSNIHEKTGMLVIALMHKNKEEIVYNPGPQEKLDPTCILVCMGDIEQVQKLRALAEKK